MVCAQRIATVDVNLERDEVAHFNLARSNGDLMRMQPAQGLRRIGDFTDHIGTRDDASVTHLATTFAIKGCLVGDYRHRIIGDG